MWSSWIDHIGESVSLNVELKKLQRSGLSVSSHSAGADSSHLRPLSAGVAMLTSVPLEGAPSRRWILHPAGVTPAAPLFLLSFVCPYRCFSVIPPSSSLKRCSPPEALPLLSTAALNAPTPVMLAPDSRSFVDNGAGRSLAVGVHSVEPLCVQGCCSPSFAIFYIYHYARADVSGKVAERRGTFIRGWMTRTLDPLSGGMPC